MWMNAKKVLEFVETETTYAQIFGEVIAAFQLIVPMGIWEIQTEISEFF